LEYLGIIWLSFPSIIESRVALSAADSAHPFKIRAPARHDRTALFFLGLGGSHTTGRDRFLVAPHQIVFIHRASCRARPAGFWPA
jgi:hypothetical protein